MLWRYLYRDAVAGKAGRFTGSIELNITPT